MAVPLSVTVSFVFREENEIEGYSPPAPPVLFEVPYDVFFPFESGGGRGDPNAAPAGAVRTSAWISITLTSVSCALLMWWSVF